MASTEVYHCLNRGTEKRPIAMDEDDKKRFVRELFSMNDRRNVENFGQNMRSKPIIDLRGRLLKRDRLVTVHAWCLMGNHYHLLLSDVVEGGIGKFLMKFNVGYTKYFNAKYERSGVLYQGRTKKVLINSERQYLYILPYIHLNPLDLLSGHENWRRQCPTDSNGALSWVTEYRWSSYRNYTGESEFAEVLEGSELFQHRSDYVAEMQRFLRTSPEVGHPQLNLE